MESLEDRRLLAVTVGNELDTLNGDVASIAALVADDGGDGISLREAISAANNTDGPNTIEFAPSVQGTIELQGGQLEVTDDLTINGPGQDTLTVSGGGESRVFHVQNTEPAPDIIDVTEVAIKGLTISDGLEVGGFFTQGAGIFNEGGVLSLDHVVVKNNRLIGPIVGGGAGIANDDGLLTVTHSSFENNLVTGSPFFPVPVSGGGILANGGSLLVTHSRFAGNSAEGGPAPAVGGAIAVLGDAVADISHNRFIGNSVSSDDADPGLGGAGANGGALASFAGATTTIAHSVFVGNSANGALARGGGIVNLGTSTLTVHHGTFVHNRAIGESEALGGGVFNSGTMALGHSNVNANQALAIGGGQGIGGGIYNGTVDDDDPGLLTIDEVTSVHGNRASTSHDDVFRDPTLLDAILTT